MSNRLYYELMESLLVLLRDLEAYMDVLDWHIHISWHGANIF